MARTPLPKPMAAVAPMKDNKSDVQPTAVASPEQAPAPTSAPVATMEEFEKGAPPEQSQQTPAPLPSLKPLNKYEEAALNIDPRTELDKIADANGVGWIRDKGIGDAENAKPTLFKGEVNKTPATLQEMVRQHINKFDEDAEKKKRKRQAIFAALGDGLSSLANLYFTTKGAPNMLKNAKMLGDAQQARWDKVDAQKREKEKEYWNQYYRRMKLDNARDAAADKAKAAADKAKADDKFKRWKAEQDAKHKADTLWQKTDAANKSHEEKVRHNKATEAEKTRRNDIYEAKPSGGSRGGSGRVGEYPWYDESGNKHYAKSYEAMRQNAIDAGTWIEGTQTSTSTTERTGKNFGTSTTTKTSSTKGSSKKAQDKKQIQGFGGSSNSGKKKVAGFGSK